MKRETAMFGMVVIELVSEWKRVAQRVSLAN